MLYEKKKLLAHKLIWSFLFLAGIIIPIVLIIFLPTKTATIVDDNGYINSYYEYTNTSTCEIEVTFDMNVESGNIKVAFYDANQQLLSTEEGYLFGYGKTLSHTFYSIDGKVDSYKILDCTVSVSNNNTTLIVYCSIMVNIITFAFFISSLFLSCKIYDYNGAEIIVYAGWYHHYIKVSQVKLDEHNTLISFSPIVLSTTLGNGTKIQATISLTNRISLKINDQLYLNRR